MDRRNFLKLTGAATTVALTVEAPHSHAAMIAGEELEIAQDLAFGRPVRVSSTAYAPTPGQCAVDGTRLSWWTSAPRDPSWIEVDLQALCMVNRIRILFPHEPGDVPPRPTRWTPAHDVLGSYAVAYNVELSTDGKKWNTVFYTNNGVGGELHLRIDPQSARYVRLTCKRRSYLPYGTAVSSLEVFGTCAVPRPAPGGWTAPRPARKSASPVLPPREDGHLVDGWEMEMIGPGGTHADGAVISTTRFNSRTWHEATVPGTVLTTLVDQGVFPDPLFGLNNLQIPEALNQYSWWYRKTFILPASYANKRVWLNFDGINFTAEVWLNGKRIGDIEGAFIRGIFDITGALKDTGKNVLAVKVNPVPHPGLPDEQSWKTGAGLNGGEPTRDGPNFFCTIGWDWIPGIRDRCTGIWNHVFLTTTGPVTLCNPHIKTSLPLPDTSSATLSVAADVFNTSRQSVHGVLKGHIDHIAFQKNITLNAGETRTVAFDTKDFPQLLMKHPRLWWPNGYGEQYLYEVNLSFEINGQESDSATTQFGVRQFEYEKLPELVIKCNGHKIMCRGGDWGLDEAMKRIPYKSMEAWIRMHHLAHITIIRNWTGESNSEELFALCDKYGILVWTEFWMANPGDGPNPDNPSMLLANAEDTFKHYRNHACIAIWCGRNEGAPPAMINAALNTMAHELDGTRYYQPGSSFAGVQSGGPYCFQEPINYFSPRYDGFKTEIGSVSVPTLDSLKTAMPEDKLWPPHNDTWAYHDYCMNGAMNITTYEAAMHRRFGATGNIKDFVQRAQILNYEVYRGIFEGYMSKLWHNASGVILWMSHPAQHSTVWQLYAHDFEAHASLYGAKKGCEPIHVQLSPEDGSVDVINNTIKPLHGITVAALIYNIDGTVAGQTHHAMDADANAKTHGFKLKLPGQFSDAYFVRLTIHDEGGKLLGDNFYWQGKHNDDLRGMNSMPHTRPTGKVVIKKHGTMFHAAVTLHNTTTIPAIAIKLTPRKENMTGPTSRILPAFISDNYFSLMPGESKTVTLEFHQDDTDGKKPAVEISGWNITPETIACDGGIFRAVASVAVASQQWQLGPFKRVHDNRPLLKANPDAVFLDPIAKKDIRWEFSHVFNPAAIAWNGKLHVLFRAEDNTGRGIGSYTSRIGLAESSDGRHFKVLPHPVLYPDPGKYETLEWPGGCEDPRVVQSENGLFYITYTMWNHKTWQLGIATSEDLLHWKQPGPAFADNLRSKSGSIVTRKVDDKVVAARINGRYHMYWHNGGEICLATSDDLLHWSPVLNAHGQLVIVLPRQAHGHFDSALTEPGPPALVTENGIVLLFNGVGRGHIMRGPKIPAGRYSAGQALFAADNPAQLLARSDEPFLWPKESWELTGQYKSGTTFVEGLAWFKNQWFLFYGAADTDVGLAVAPA